MNQTRTPSQLTPEEKTYALRRIGRHGVTPIAKKLGLKPSALAQWSSRQGIYGGVLTTQTNHAARMSVSDVAIAAQVTPHSIHRLATEHGVLTFAGTKDKKRRRGHIAYVPTPWAKAFIEQQREQRDNAELLNLGWKTVHQTASTLGVTPTVISAALRGRGMLSTFLTTAQTKQARLPGRGGLALLIDPQTVDTAKAHLNRERAETGSWIQTKVLMLELSTSYPTILRHARKHGCEPRWVARDGISMRVIPPRIAAKIRASVQASVHVRAARRRNE